MIYQIKNIEELDSPALIVFKEQVAQNIAHAVRMVGDVDKLRPHVKTNKSADACKLMLAAGIYKFKCATIAEAEMLANCGAKDVLLAYQPLGPKAERFAALIQKYPDTSYSCLTDDLYAATAMAAFFQENGLEVPVFIDLNVGMNRTGIAPAKALELYEACAKLDGIRPVGIQAYDGHIRDVDLGLRKAKCDTAFQAVEDLAKAIKNSGLPAPTIIAGGSPTFPIHAARQEVECSPGTFIYWDKGYSDLCPEQPFRPAAVLVTRVISLPDSTKICLDLGHKSVAAENELAKRVYFPDAPELKPIGQSEEHLVMEAGEGHPYKVGDVLMGIPYHICPTVALYERVFVIENSQMTGEWKTTSRDRRLTV
jgi:D-serine deaminase-like pyridoxal phosphate-dependent protein